MDGSTATAPGSPPHCVASLAVAALISAVQNPGPASRARLLPASSAVPLHLLLTQCCSSACARKARWTREACTAAAPRCGAPNTRPPSERPCGLISRRARVPAQPHIAAGCCWGDAVGVGAAGRENSQGAGWSSAPLLRFTPPHTVPPRCACPQVVPRGTLRHGRGEGRGGEAPSVCASAAPHAARCAAFGRAAAAALVPPSAHTPQLLMPPLLCGRCRLQRRKNCMCGVG